MLYFIVTSLPEEEQWNPTLYELHTNHSPARRRLRSQENSIFYRKSLRTGYDEALTDYKQTETKRNTV
jgi:hypothetical protein